MTLYVFRVIKSLNRQMPLVECVTLPPQRNIAGSPHAPEDREHQASQPGQGRPAEEGEQKKIKLPSSCCDWIFLVIIAAGSTYLDSRNTRCAILSVNARQTLKKQAEESVDFIWQTF